MPLSHVPLPGLTLPPSGGFTATLRVYVIGGAGVGVGAGFGAGFGAGAGVNAGIGAGVGAGIGAGVATGTDAEVGTGAGGGLAGPQPISPIRTITAVSTSTTGQEVILRSPIFARIE